MRVTLCGGRAQDRIFTHSMNRALDSFYSLVARVYIPLILLDHKDGATCILNVIGCPGGSCEEIWSR